MKQLNTISLIVLLQYFFVPVVNAQTLGGNTRSNPEHLSSYNLVLGLAFLSVPSIYLNHKRNEQIIPIIEWSWKNWFIRDFRFGSYVAANDQWYLSSSLGIESIASVNREKNNFTSSNLKNRDEVYNAALTWGWIDPWGIIRMSLERDISQGHNSQSVSLAYSCELSITAWSIEPYAKLKYLPNKVVNYYYGIEQSEVKSGYPAYQARHAYTAHIGINVTYAMNQSHALIFSTGYQEISSEIKNSPIVERDGVASITAGYIYAF